MITNFPESGVFFTSDTHFNHKSILQLCNRPFNSIEEHDQKLIENWNSVVGVEDTVFHLGDFCFGNAQKWKEIRNQLNGHIILIIGNHDVKQVSQGIASLFDYVTMQMRITINGRTVAYGSEWYGEKDLFGDGGIYYQLLNGSSTDFNMENGYTYTLELLKSADGNVGSKHLDGAGNM